MKNQCNRQMKHLCNQQTKNLYHPRSVSRVLLVLLESQVHKVNLEQMVQQVQLVPKDKTN